MIKRGSFSEARNKISFEKKRIWLTAFIVVGYSLSLYLFFLYWREMLRYQTLDEYGNMMILSPSENYFYNFFFAGLAILTGLSYGADALFLSQFRLRGYVRYSITNDFSGLQWYSVYILTKLGVFYGAFCWTGGLYQPISLYEEFWFLFPLILIVLFFNQWTKVRLFFRGTFKTMMISAFCFTLLVSALAAIPFFDYKTFNHNILKNTVKYNYSIDLPQAESSARLERKYLTEDLYIGQSKTGKTDSAAIVSHVNNALSEYDLDKMLKESKGLLEEYESDQFTISLKADKKIKIGLIRSAVDVIRENNIRLIYFMTSEWSGLKISIRPSFAEFTRDTVFFHPSYAEFLEDRKKLKILSLKIINNQIYFNDSLILKTELSMRLKNHIKLNQGGYLIDLDADDESDYQSLMFILDQLWVSVIQLRNAFAHEHFLKEYDPDKSPWEDRALSDSLAKVYPINFYFPTKKERAYLLQSGLK